MKLIRILIVWGVFLATGFAIAQQTKQSESSNVLDLPVKPGIQEGLGEFQVEVFCSPTNLGVGIATLTWNSKGIASEKQRLDLTIFKTGFEKNLFTTLLPLKSRQKFQTARLVKLPDHFNKSLYLTVGKIETEKAGQMSLVLEGLQGGVTYFWRICTLEDQSWKCGEMARIEAPICPVDSDNKKQ